MFIIQPKIIKTLIQILTSEVKDLVKCLTECLKHTKTARFSMIVAILGTGRIGEAMAKRLNASKDITKIILTKRNTSTIQHMKSEKIEISHDNSYASRVADIIIISVKAGDSKQLFEQISPFVLNKIVISLMAAVSLERLEKALNKAKVVRAMPNIAAIIGESITPYSNGKNVTSADTAKIKLILGMIGECFEVPEQYMDAITALSGSGPAYIAILIEALVTAGLKVGLPRDIAMKLAIKTLSGTANLLNQTKLHPAELRDTVTTPAGTTIAGIYELERGAFRTSVINAIEAATLAAEKIAKKIQNDP
ncbi:MAG: pyrroline-5-carboxylate reductase [Conexivisphaerales archaeon]